MISTLSCPIKGKNGDDIFIKLKKFAKKIMLPVNMVKRILYRDLNFFLSSMKPIIPAKSAVKRKIKIILIKMGKKKINNPLATEIPIRILIPPDSATSGFAFLWIS